MIFCHCDRAMHRIHQNERRRRIKKVFFIVYLGPSKTQCAMYLMYLPEVCQLKGQFTKSACVSCMTAFMLVNDCTTLTSHRQEDEQKRKIGLILFLKIKINTLEKATLKWHKGCPEME